MIKVLRVTPSFYPATYWGGPIFSVYELCNALAKQTKEIQLRVITTDSAGPRRNQGVGFDRVPVRYDAGYDVYFFRRLFGASFSPGMLVQLPGLVCWADVVHLTGVYSPSTIPTLWLSKIYRKPVVWSPHGALQRWEGSTRVCAKSAWEWVCRVVAPKNLILHVTSEEEMRESAERLTRVESILIPNGVEIPEQVSPINSQGILRLLFLGRLHPIKGIENLLACCKIFNDTSSIPWSLVIAGSGKASYTELLRDRVLELGLSHQVKMLGEVGREAKRSVFENADIAVVPSFTENFGMVVAEALAHGVPVITSKGTPWEQVGEIGCGLWVENDPESLTNAVERIRKMPLREMGQIGRKWVEKEFSWNERVGRMIQLYKMLSKKP
ncbi:glycosyltransferase [Nitrospira defluvii]|nr:glycosyltransferase [Nitrospira defluvii]